MIASLHFTFQLTEDNVFEVLYKADMYLLPGLKRNCAAYIAKLLDEDNVFSVLQLSRLFNLPKLEDQCYEFIADNIEEVGFWSCHLTCVLGMSIIVAGCNALTGTL